MKRKDYKKPMMEVIECETEQQLLAGSMQDTATIDDYENGGSILWDGAPEFFNIENE